MSSAENAPDRSTVQYGLVSHDISFYQLSNIAAIKDYASLAIFTVRHDTTSAIAITVFFPNAHAPKKIADWLACLILCPPYPPFI
jgi:hypothetical protein